MIALMNVHVTTSAPIGERCAAWAKEHLPSGVVLTGMEECDIFISVFYNKLISADFIASKKRCLNFHGGILPENRGSATPNWAIINGDAETGITLHEIDARVDHGPIIEVRRFALDPNETGVTVMKKMEELIFAMFTEWFARLATLDYTATPQDDRKARRYTRADFQNAKDLTRFARAYHYPPYEQAYYYNAKGEKIYLVWE